MVERWPCTTLTKEGRRNRYSPLVRTSYIRSLSDPKLGPRPGPNDRAAHSRAPVEDSEARAIFAPASRVSKRRRHRYDATTCRVLRRLHVLELATPRIHPGRTLRCHASDRKQAHQRAAPAKASETRDRSE